MQSLSLVLGGAASGKSAYAEGLCLASGRPRAYVATAEAHDAEMAARIARHRLARGPDWRNVEAPRDVAGTLRAAAPEEVVLLDCATLWLTNVILDEGADMAAEVEDLLAALAACAAPCVVVSNEVGLGIVPDTPLGRRFRDAQGALNRRIAERADLVVLVAAGLPLVLKGATP